MHESDEAYTVIYPPDTEVYDTPDILPPETAADRQWYFLNRWAESCAAYLQLFGLW